jgi:hypothetical protein
MSDSQNSNSNDIAQRLLSDPLDLPDGAGFVSSVPRMDLLQMIKVSELYLPILNSRPDYKEQKMRKAFSVPFEL